MHSHQPTTLRRYCTFWGYCTGGRPWLTLDCLQMFLHLNATCPAGEGSHTVAIVTCTKPKSHKNKKKINQYKSRPDPTNHSYKIGNKWNNNNKKTYLWHFIDSTQTQFNSIFDLIWPDSLQLQYLFIGSMLPVILYALYVCVCAI